MESNPKKKKNIEKKRQSLFTFIFLWNGKSGALRKNECKRTETQNWYVLNFR